MSRVWLDRQNEDSSPIVGTGKRIFGLETEFGCFVRDESIGAAEQAVEMVKNHTFSRKRIGAIDHHARDEAFEPARSGGFLINGGRLYVDAVGSHEEYATAECSDLVDIVAQDKAGQRILVSCVNALGWQDKVSFHNNSVDHFGGQTFGCHENYLVRGEDRFFTESVHALWPFLCTRQIFAGAGRVGGHRLEQAGFRPALSDLHENPIDYIWVSHVYGVEPDPGVEYQLSQRADHIVKTVASRVRFNRAIVNPKWDSYYSFVGLHRLHLLFGEANMSEYALALKVGATSLTLDLIEANAVPPDMRLADPLTALKSVSRDPSWRWLVKLEDGRTIPAVDVQRAYLDAASDRLSGRDAQTDWILTEWETTLDALERNPWELADRLDWVIKRKIVESYLQETGLKWGDDALHSIDLEYHNIDPERGLYFAMEQMGETKRIITDEKIEEAVVTPPANTRAHGRARIVRRLLEKRSPRYYIDWDMVYVDRNRQIELRDPFDSYAEEADRFAATI